MMTRTHTSYYKLIPNKLGEKNHIRTDTKKIILGGLECLKLKN